MHHSFKILVILSSLLLTSCTGLVAGWEAQKSGNYDEAMRQAAIALAKEPKNPEVYRLIATTHYARGKYDLAANAADFARSLDGGNEKTESLIRDIAYAQKQWAAYCESAMRSTENGRSWADDELPRMTEVYGSLGTSADAYGCLSALESAGQSPAGAEDVKAAYADYAASTGKPLVALQIDESLANPRYNQLQASRRLFALNRTDEGADRLHNYVASATPEQKEARILEAAQACGDYQKWAIQSEILAQSEVPENALTRGIALRKQFRQAESDEVFNRYFAGNDRSAAQTLDDMKRLIAAGYAEPAATAYTTCAACAEDIPMSFDAAEILFNAGMVPAADQILTQISENHPDDAGLQLRIFNRYLDKHLPKQAIIFGERADKLGAGDDDFKIRLLEAYLDARQVRVYERESAAYLEKQPAPAADARQALARIEVKRANWEGILTLLGPVVDELTPQSQDIYIQSLKMLQRYPELLAYLDKLDRHKPLEKAAYFQDAQAETEYKKALEPMLSGSKADQADARFALAEYYLVFKEDDEKAHESVEEFLKASDYSEDSYTRAVGFLKANGMTDDAVDYAKKWQTAFPKSAEPCMILGQIYLRNHQIEKADDSFSSYVQNSAPSVDVMMTIYQQYSQNRENEAGIEWFENKLPAALNAAPNARDASQNPNYAEALMRIYKFEYDSHKNTEIAAVYREKAIQNGRKLAELNPQSALSAAITLTALEDYEGACSAFESARKQDTRWKAAQKRENIRAMIRAGKPENTIVSTLSVFFCDGPAPCMGDGKNSRQTTEDAKETEVFDMVEFLETEQALHLGRNLLEQQLDNPNPKTRIKAYHYLFRMAMSDGDTALARAYSQKLEKSAENHDDIQLRLAESALAMGDFDAAVNSLTRLQMTRPDSREVLNMELRLANRAPEHKGAQALVETSLDAAEGVHHRLAWISEFFEQYGDYPRALHYAEKAHAATTVTTDENRRRLVRLCLMAGTPDAELCQNTLARLRSSNYWNAANIAGMAEDAQTAGYPDIAQDWMREAIAIAPQDERNAAVLTKLKRRKLEMALESESDGQIAQSLENAVTAPVAEVMDPLRKNGSMLNAIDAIDLFEQNGEYQMALASMFSVLDEYLQTRGVSTTLRNMQEYSAAAPGYEDEVARIMAGHALMSDNPCTAMSYAADLQAPDIWAGILIRCTDARSNVISAIDDLRSTMPPYRRNSFDKDLYRSLLDAKNPESAEFYANSIGFANDAYEQFRRAFLTRGGLAAMKELAKNPVEKEKIRQVYTTLAAAGFTAEANDYAKARMNELPKETRAYLSASAVLMGSRDAVFTQNLPGTSPKNLPEMTDDEAAQLLSVDSLKNWLHDSTSYELGPVIQTAVRCAAANPAQRHAIVDAVQKEIESRHTKTAFYTTLAQAESLAGLDEEAAATFKKLHEMQPASDYYCRMLSAAQARLGKYDDAWKTARKGASLTAQLDGYWQEMARLHQNSPADFRMRINDAQLAIAPRNPDILADRVEICLQNGAKDDAEKYALLAHQAGKNRILNRLADIYDHQNALADMPAALCTGSENSPVLCAARIAQAQGDQERAMQKYLEAAQSSPWPIQAYAELAQAFVDQKKWPQAEQTIAQMMAKFPHAYTPFVYRAMDAVAQNHTDDAWNDYLSARSRALDTRSWIAPLIRICAMTQNADFAKKLYHSEIELGTIDDTIWTDTLMDVFLDPQNAHKHEVSPKEWAQTGVRFIDKVMPRTSFLENDQNRMRFSQLTYISTH